MPKKDNMPSEGARLLAGVLAEVRPADVGMLRDLELDWPGSRALLARLGLFRTMSRKRDTQSHQQRAAAGPVELQVTQHARLGRAHLPQGLR